MNRINIDHLTEAELIDLNHRIIERVRLMNQVRAHDYAAVSYRRSRRLQTRAGTSLFGILTRYNRKSVTVITDSGQRWNVSPRFLRLAEAGQESANTQSVPYSDSVIPFKPK